MSTFASKEGSQWKQDAAQGTADSLFNLLGRRLDEILKDSNEKLQVMEEIYHLRGTVIRAIKTGGLKGE